MLTWHLVSVLLVSICFVIKFFYFSSLILENKRKSFYWFRCIYWSWCDCMPLIHMYACLFQMGHAIRLTWHWFWIVWSSWVNCQSVHSIIVINCYHILLKKNHTLPLTIFLLLKVLWVDSLLLYWSSGILYICFKTY